MLFSFLISDDLDAAIKEEQLTQLVRDNMGLVASAEAASISWMKDYLGQRFDLASTFPVIGEWSPGNDYGPAQPVTVPGVALSEDPFYNRDVDTESTTYTPLFAYNSAGRLTNYAWHLGLCYEAITTSLALEPGVGDGWETAWRIRDPRDAKLVSFATDIALFNLFRRVAPRRIPELRVQLYNQAKEWLTLVRDGSLTPSLPRPIRLADNSDSIRWGSNAARPLFW